MAFDDELPVQEADENKLGAAAGAAADDDDAASHDDSNDSDDEMAKHTWEMRGISQIVENKIYSPEYELENFKWRFMIFPRGNKVTDMISIYLEVLPEGKEVGWKCNAQFQLTVVNKKNPKKSVRQDSSHIFRAGATDWGFAKFHSLKELLDPENGFLVDDTLTLFVEMEVIQSAALYYSWDSRKETGFVGLRNQGATCYMNSLLQTMFFNGAFRRAVYSLPTSAESGVKSIALALQRLFYGLQHSGEAVGTEELTKAFGWDSYESFTQHDVQELARVLCDNLEQKFKGTPAEGTIDRLWSGKLFNYIRCLHVDYASTRIENFLDVSLNVRGMKNVYDAFESYCAEEILSGADQYSTDGHGKQDAAKGIKFEAFPPVLNLHLKRFEFDWTRNCYSKINDRFEYPAVLELDKYLTETADKSVPQTYDLYGVLIHSGGAQGGHYYAFCRPTNEPSWYKFDDDRVSAVKEKDALNANYGMSEKDSLGAVHRFRSLRLSRRFTTAYMLIYVRRADAHWVMEPCGDDAVPAHIRDAVAREAHEHAEEERIRREAHLYSSIKVLRESHMAAHGESDLVTLPSIEPIKIKSDAPIAELLRVISTQDGVAPERYRLWACVHRENGTLRVAKLLPPEIYAQSVRTHITLYRGTPDLKVFAQVLPEGEPAFPADGRLVFLKYYSPAEKELRFIGAVTIDATTTVDALAPVVNARAGNPAGTALIAVEEVTATRIEPLPGDRVFGERGIALGADVIGTGDIVVYQAAAPAEGLEHRLAADFYGYLATRLRVTFKPLKTPEDAGVLVDLVYGMEYDDVTRALGAKLAAPGENIRITQVDMYTKKPRLYPMARLIVYPGLASKQYKIQDMLYVYQGYTQQRADTLYYEVLDVSLAELESKMKVEFDYHSAAGKFVSKHSMLVDKLGVVGDLVAKFLTDLVVPEGEARPERLRMMEISNHKASKVLGSGEPLRILTNYYSYRLEPLPAEDLAPPAGARPVFFNHYAKNPHHTFGDPFVMYVREGETAGALKARVKARMAVSEEEWAKWKFAYVSFNTSVPMEDEMQALPRSHWASDWIGIKHEGMTPEEAIKLSPSKVSYHTERAIKIYN